MSSAMTPLRRTLGLAVAAVSIGCLAVASAQAGLVAHWTLDEPVGTTGEGSVIDTGFAAHNGTPTGTVVFGGGGAGAATGTSAKFNIGGGSGAVNIPYSADLNPAEFTVTAWANPTIADGAPYSVITNRSESTGSTTGYIIYNYQGSWQFWTGSGGGPGSWNALAGPAVQTNRWTHLAISYAAGAGMTLYVDGSPAASMPAATYAPNGDRGVHIGAGQDAGNGFYFQGDIDDVMLFDAALDTASIVDVMNNSAPPVADNLSLGKTYSYSRLPQYSGGTYYFDEPHVQTVGVFDTGDLTDGELFPTGNAPTAPNPSTIVGWDPAELDAEIIVDLEELSTVTSVTVGTHTWAAFQNGAPDSVAVSFSTTGAAPGDFGSPVAETFAAPPRNGHHNLTVAVPGTQARYVKLTFDGGAIGNHPTNKWMLDEITVKGAVVPEPTTCTLLALALLGLAGLIGVRRRAA